jgi:hypothetical protein
VPTGSVRRLLACIALSLAVIGCSTASLEAQNSAAPSLALTPIAGHSRTQGSPACPSDMSLVRCLVLADGAAFRLNTTRENVIAVEVLPEPSPPLVLIDGKLVPQKSSSGGPLVVRVTLADGSTHDVSMGCGGVNMSPVCVSEPRLTARANNDRDYPEGATPVPTAAPDALADAAELRIDRLDIPIDHVGLFEVELGQARLPNGLLTHSGFKLVDDWPSDITILDGNVDLEVRSMEDGKPHGNLYEHGWRQGTELVEAVLVFDVFRFESGAVLSITDVVVR